MARKKKTSKGKAGKAKSGGGKKRDSLVVASKVKAYVRGKGFIAAGDLVESVNAAVYRLLDSATGRTEANKRSTVRPQDL